MLQIKIFRFRINNKTSVKLDDDEQMGWYNRELSEIYSTDKMEEVLNEFLSSHDVVEIKCVPVVCRINLDKIRGDDVDLVYSIVYKVEEQSKNFDNNLSTKKIYQQIEQVPLYKEVPIYNELSKDSSGNVSPYSPDFPRGDSGTVINENFTQITAQSDNNFKNGFIKRNRVENIYEE